MFRDLMKETERRREEFVVIRIPMAHGLNYIDAVPMAVEYADLFTNNHARYLDPLPEMRAIPNWVAQLYLPDGHMSVAGDHFLADYLYKRVFENRRQW